MSHQVAEMRKCIDDCVECYRICAETTSHCLQLGGKHADAVHIRLLLGCADVCNTSATSMLLGSESSAQICAVCAEVCENCAQSCAQLAGDDDLVKRCADVCRRCVSSCRDMSGMQPGSRAA